uniref:Uncharacterized protein n=1 Tax=Chenopodium quinoa TaxID=63459 RepID=A0A803N660_CHEQI
MIGQTPTLRLWRNFFKLIPYKENFGVGWWEFRICNGFKVVQNKISNVKNRRGQLIFVYCRTWDIPLVPNLEEPNLSLNYDNPHMTTEEAVVTFCLETKGLVINGDPVQLPMTWIPDRAFLEDEKKTCTISLCFRSFGYMDTDALNNQKVLALRASAMRKLLKNGTREIPLPTLEKDPGKSYLNSGQDTKAKLYYGS